MLFLITFIPSAPLWNLDCLWWATAGSLGSIRHAGANLKGDVHPRKRKKDRRKKTASFVECVLFVTPLRTDWLKGKWYFFVELYIKKWRGFWKIYTFFPLAFMQKAWKEGRERERMAQSVMWSFLCREQKNKLFWGPMFIWPLLCMPQSCAFPLFFLVIFICSWFVPRSCSLSTCQITVQRTSEILTTLTATNKNV